MADEEEPLPDEDEQVILQEIPEQLSVQQLGCSPLVWRDALFKRIVESQAGRGGVEALCQYSDQMNFIPELRPLRYAMKSETLFYETVQAKCSKDLLKRPVSVRENEAVEILACVCEKCGFTSTFRVLIANRNRCPRCGSTQPLRSKVLYTKVLLEMIKEGLDPTPEAVLMYVAHDKLANAFIAAFRAMKLIMEKTCEVFGWQSFRIEDPQLRNYLDSYRLGRFAGETKTSREEKEVLQFLARGCMAGASLEDAERLIRLALRVMKYGYLFQVLTVMGANVLYNDAVLEYDELYDRMNEEIRRAYLETYAPVSEEPKVTIVEMQEGDYAPCFITPQSYWESGSISKGSVMKPYYRLPVFPKADFGALQAIFARLGGGKTFLISAVACYSVLSKHEVVFCPLNDESNSYSLAGIPLFGYDRRTRGLLETLNTLGVEPQGVPTITLTVLRKGERVEDVNNHPPTVFDRVVEVENPQTFEIDFKQVMRELKEAAEPYGYSRPVGIVCVRNMQRGEGSTRTNFDVQVTSSLLSQFNKWRKGNVSLPARVILDEISYIASAELPAQYAGDAARSKSAVSDFIKESRRNNLSMDVATQRPLEVISDIRDAATNVFFRDLPLSRDKARSQIDFLLDGLQLADPAIRDVVASINNHGSLGTGFWFWYHQPAKRIEVIKPVPPTFCLHDKGKTMRQLLRLYEKETGKNVLRGGWDEVQHLEAAELKQEELEDIR